MLVLSKPQQRRLEGARLSLVHPRYSMLNSVLNSAGTKDLLCSIWGPGLARPAVSERGVRLARKACELACAFPWDDAPAGFYSWHAALAQTLGQLQPFYSCRILQL